MRVSLTCSFLFLIGPLVLAAQSHLACDPVPEVQAALDRAAALADECGEAHDCWDRRRELLERELAERPADLHLHREYQNLFLYSRRQDAQALAAEVSERYAALAAEHPESAAYAYLEGRIARDAEEARGAFERAVEAAPGFPWGHLGLTSHYARSGPDDAQRVAAGRHLRRFMQLCPWRFEGLWYARLLDDDDFLRRRLAQLRAHPERLTPDHYRQIWRLEFRLEPPGEHEAVRGRVRADLERLTSAGGSYSKAARRVILEGYELVGDFGAIEKLEADEARRSPCSEDSVRLRVKRWQEENPRPDRDAPAEERQAWGRLHHQASGEWIDQCPDSFEVRLERFMAVAAVETSSEPEVISAADAWLALWEIGASPLRMSPSPPALVARVLLKRKVGLDRVPGLLERARAELDRDHESQTSRASLPEEAREQIELLHHSGVNELRGLLAAAYLELGRAQEVEPLLLDMRTDLEKHFTDTSVEPGQVLRHDLAYRVARLDALLAEKEDRKLDAIVYHRRAASLTARPEEHVQRATELWQQLGGSEASWQVLAETGDGPAETSSGWLSVDEPLEPFELLDANGSTWRLADLAGKTVFANLWATWCGPCHNKMPLVQALYERLAGREDVAVITLNMDQNLGLVAPFLEKNGYTFPVLLASDYLRRERGLLSIPRNWIIGGDGTLLREQIGYRGDLTPEAFIEEALRALNGRE